jgi:NAD(P)-dependent dehydrogenase (short-subunit alcohol dehydrogenase family)
VVMVSSQQGSMQWKQDGGNYAYSMSKAAMNMAARTLAYELRPQGIRAITLHPGWVVTDMGGEKAELTPEESASSIRDLIGKVSLKDSGSFYKWNGTPHVW